MAFLADQFIPQMESPNEWVDFDQFLDLPTGYDDQSTATTISPQDLALPYESDEMFTSPAELMQPSFDMANYDIPQEDFMGLGGFMQDPAAPLFDDASFVGYNPYDSCNAFRTMVETQAAADPRVATVKEKRREAAIALHLQRLCDATALDLDMSMSSDSNTSFSSPSWSDYVRASTSPRPSPENTSTSEAPPPGGIEMVLDLNMNATSNVPKKQKPRSQAQKENYIKARKYGACEKHKKQHKRCNCLEKAAARAGVSDLPTTAAFQERPTRSMLQVPILPEARYAGSPGHDPTSQIPQALPSLKMIRKPTSNSSGHDVLTRLPVVPQDIARTKSQTSTSPGLDTVPPGVPGFKNVSGHGVVSSPGKLTMKNSTPAHIKTAPPGRNTANNSSATHDTVCSGRNVVVAGKNAGINSSSGHDIVTPSGRNTVVSHKSVVRNAYAGHDTLIVGKKVSNTAGIDQGHDARNYTTPQNVRTTSSESSRLRWRVSTSASVGVVSSARADTTSTSTNLPTTGVYCTPSSDARRSRTVRSSGAGSKRFAPGSIAAGLGIRDCASPACNLGSEVVRPERNRDSRGLASLAVRSGVQSGPKDQVALPYGLGSPDAFGNCSPDNFGPVVLQSLARPIRGMLTRTVMAVACAWHSSLSFTSQAESVTLKCLSLSGRYLMSAKKGLHLLGLRT